MSEENLMQYYKEIDTSRPVSSTWGSSLHLRNMDVSKNSGIPKSSILIRFSIVNHPFGGPPIFGNTHFWWIFEGIPWVPWVRPWILRCLAGRFGSVKRWVLFCRFVSSCTATLKASCSSFGSIFGVNQNKQQSIKIRLLKFRDFTNLQNSSKEATVNFPNDFDHPF